LQPGRRLESHLCNYISGLDARQPKPQLIYLNSKI
jgi:hypothetical protein